MSRWTCLLALLACAVVAAHAAGKPTAFTLADLGTATGMAANCSEPTGGSGMPAYWIEMTDLLNFTQYKNDADSDISDLPSPLPFPYSETASDARAPGWVSTCISRSPTAPEDCEGDACNVYIEEWGVDWLEFATLNCFGGYPNASGVDFFANPQPAPGNVALTVTETCKNYYYGPTDQWNYFWAVTDEWGNKWALQTSHMNDTTTDEFDANIESVVWPAGWGPAEKVTLTETVEMVPLMVGEACFAMIIKDSNFNSWHLYTYPEGGLTSGNSLLGAMGDTCTVLDAQYTLSNMDELEAEDSATTDTSSTDEADTAAPAPTEATSAASAGAPGLLLLLGAAAAVAAVL